MKKLLIALLTCCAVPALGADLASKQAAPVVPPAPVISVSPFYVGVLGGGGFSSTESDITVLGTAQGPLKAYPTGVLAGGEFGARWNTGTFTLGLNVSALYDFSRASVGINGVAGSNGTVFAFAANSMSQPAASMKNGLLLMEGGSFGINLSTLMGYVPTSAQPGNWPVPIVVPTNLAGNLSINAIGGLAQRWVTLCAGVPDPVLIATLDPECASKIINGPYIGGELTGMLSTNWEAKFKVAHIFWNSSFTPTSPAATALASAGVFSTTTSAKDETIGLAGLAYHF